MIAMGVAVLVVANDFTALSVALPAIERDLHTDVTTVQWVINGYAMVFGVLIVTGGRLADMFGRRRIFMLGATLFAGVLRHRRIRSQRLGAAGLPLPDGHWRRDDVARHPRHDLRTVAAEQSRARRRRHSGRSRIRQRGRSAARRPAHRQRGMALDLLRQPARRRHRPSRSPCWWCRAMSKPSIGQASTISAPRCSPSDCSRCCSHSIGHSTSAGPRPHHRSCSSSRPSRWSAFLFIERRAGDQRSGPRSRAGRIAAFSPPESPPCWPRPSSSPRCSICRSSCRRISASPPWDRAQDCCP